MPYGCPGKKILADKTKAVEIIKKYWNEQLIYLSELCDKNAYIEVSCLGREMVYLKVTKSVHIK